MNGKKNEKLKRNYLLKNYDLKKLKVMPYGKIYVLNLKMILFLQPWKK